MKQNHSVTGVVFCCISRVSRIYLVYSIRHERKVDEVAQPRPFKCRLGLHDWFGDGGLFTRVERCRNCPAVSSPEDAAEVARERALWSRHSRPGIKPAEQLKLVVRDFDLGISP